LAFGQVQYISPTLAKGSRDKLPRRTRTFCHTEFSPQVSTLRRIRIGIIGGKAWSEWGILPTLLGADASAPPDDGAWWSRRPTAGAAIRWQAPYRAEVLALCESDDEKRARIGATFRITAQYSNAQSMLRENSLDAVFCEDASEENLPELVAALASSGGKYLWLGGAPASTSGEALELAHWAAAHGVRVWYARSVRRAAAHRAAIQLVKRGEIGDVTALALRWSTPFCPAPDAESSARSATFAALDLLLACAGGAPVSTLLSEVKSTSHLGR
jgi:predicted dehydrogenase